jgi:hypothetical protein
VVAAIDDEIERFVLQCGRSVPGTLEPKIREIRIAQPIRQQMIAQPIRQQMIAQPIRQQIFSTAPSGNTPSKTKRDQHFRAGRLPWNTPPCRSNPFAEPGDVSGAGW